MSYRRVSFTTIALMLLSMASFAATQGQMILSGVVTTVFSITVTPNSRATSLNIEGGESNTAVGSVNEQANNPGGYKITVVSANNGSLVHNSNNSSSLNYSISYNGGSNFQPSTTSTTVKTVSSLSTPANSSSDVKITFTGKSNAIGGTYSDTLTFEISAP